MEGDSRNWRVLRNDKVGRFVVAGRDLEPGDVVFSELPFVYGPKADTPPLCLGCYCPADGSVLCSKCGWPVCGSECEEQPMHKNAECKIFSDAQVRFQPVEDITRACPQYECITHLRFLLAIEANPEQWQTEVKTLESHVEQRQQHPIWAFNQTNIVDYLLGPCKLKDRADDQLLHLIIGILEVNAFEGKTATGYAFRVLYPKLSFVSHKCVSNITHSTPPVNANGEEYRMYFRATIKIPAGQELFSSYTLSLSPTMLRREHLKKETYFDCSCGRCADPTELGTHLSTLKCTKCDNGLVMSTNSLDSEAQWKCTHCEFSANGETIRKVLHEIRSELDRIELAGNDSHGIEEREKLFRKYISVLHPNHAFMMFLRHSLNQMYGHVEGYMLEDLPDILLERKVKMCQQLLGVLDVIEPGLSRLRGKTLYELHAPLLLLARSLKRHDLIDKNGLRTKLDEVVKLLEEAAMILKLEPVNTPEGIIGQVAVQSLQQFKDNIDILMETS